MVRLGILCEGESEIFILESETFNIFLTKNSIELVAIRPVGSKNQYWQDRIESHIAILEDVGVDHILIMVDLDKDSCITFTRSEIKTGINRHVVVSVKEFENWYLADNNALSKMIGKKIASIGFPEEEEEPVRKITQLNNGRGFGGSKPRIAKNMVRCGFSLENAAQHSNCPSATYFLNKLQQLAKQ